MTTKRRRVPLLDLQAQYPPLRTSCSPRSTRVCDSQRFILGPEVDALERELAARLDVADAIAVSSGTDALLAALMALGIGPGDEVVTSTYSFFATAGCVARLGATPCSSTSIPDTSTSTRTASRGHHAADPRDHPGAPLRPVRRHGSDPGRRRARPASRSSRMRPGHRRELQGRQAGAMGTVGCFSFFPSKNLGAVRRRRAGHDGRCGAGARAPAAAQSRRRAEVLPQADRRQLPARRAAGGGAAREAAAPGRWTDMRRQTRSATRRCFGQRVSIAKSRCRSSPPDRPHLQPIHRAGADPRPRSRALDAAGIGTEIYYPVPFHLQECFAALGYRR